MGTIYRRGPMWYLDYRDQAGRRIRERVGRDRRQAEAVLRLRQGDVVMDRHQLPKVRRLLFEDFAWDWYRVGDWKPRTREGYARTLSRHLVPAFRGLTLGAVTPSHVEAYRAEVRARLAPATVTLHLAVLTMLFRRAVRLGLVQRNPLDGVQKGARRSHGPSVVRVLTPEQLRVLRAALPEDYALLVLTAATTGLRRGELLALEWDDVKVKANTLLIRRSRGWVQGERGYELATDTTKSGRERVVRVPPNVMQALAALPSRFRGGRVFLHADGRVIEPSAVLNKILRRACRRAGVPEIRFHDLRHTCASLLIALGAHPKYIQEQLGHASITTTLDTYGHLMSGFHQGEAERLGALVLGDADGHNLVTNADS